MATFSRNSRILKLYRSPPHPYCSIGPIDVKPKRVRISFILFKNRAHCKAPKVSYCLFANM